MNFRLIRTALSLLIVLGVAGCGLQQRGAESLAPATAGTASASALVALSATAADDLLQTAQAPISPGAPLLVTTPVDVNDFNATSPFGRLLREQLVSRFVNAGYEVVQSTMRSTLVVRPGGGQFILSREIRHLGGQTGAQAIVAGTYAATAKDLFVNLRLLRASDGRILAAHDFTLSMDDSIADLVPPRITYLNNR